MGCLEGKVVVVTGGASGIGRATALHCATAGARVIVSDIQDGEPVVAAARAVHHDVVFRRADVSISADIRGLMRWAVEQRGGLDVLIAAAGIGGGTATTAEYAEADFDHVIAINLKGVFLCMKYAIAAMLSGGGGAIVNIASVAGVVGLPHTPAYSAAKAGVVQLTKVAALEYAGSNIRVNCICPGMIDTPLVQRIPESSRQQFLDRQPIQRLGTADEIAAAAVFLASDASAFTTGSSGSGRWIYRAMKSARSKGDKDRDFHYDAAAMRQVHSGASVLGATVMTKAGDDEMADFTQVYVRRALEPRLQGHGKIDVRKSGPWGFTIVHRYTSEWNGREVALPVAQLRAKGQKLQLYWKRANGRWVPYESGEEAPFVGSLEACLKEIDHDRWGCFWG